MTCKLKLGVKSSIDTFVKLDRDTILTNPINVCQCAISFNDVNLFHFHGNLHLDPKGTHRQLYITPIEAFIIMTKVNVNVWIDKLHGANLVNNIIAGYNNYTLNDEVLH